MRISERFKEFVRHGHAYKKAIYVAAFVTIVILGLGLAFLLPNADSTSVQAGLTIIAELLGVLLGGVLVVVVLLVERVQQAEELLRGAYQKYRRLIESSLEQVDAGRQQLIEQVKSGEIQLNDPLFIRPSGIPSKTKFRDVIGNLFALTVAMRLHLFEECEDELDALGYSKDEKDEFIIHKGLVADYHPPAYFLELIKDAFDLSCMAPYCSSKVSHLASEIYEGYIQDGVDKALSQLHRSQNVLRSKTLAAAITLLTLTTIGAVMTLFGITDKTVTMPVYTWVIVLVMTGFMLSVLLTLLLIEKMLV